MFDFRARQFTQAVVATSADCQSHCARGLFETDLNIKSSTGMDDNNAHTASLGLYCFYPCFVVVG